MEKFMISVQFLSETNITHDQQFFATKSFSFFTKKLRFVGVFGYYTVNSSIFVTKKNINLFFNIIKLTKNKKTLLRTVYTGHEKTFSQPDHIIL